MKKLKFILLILTFLSVAERSFAQSGCPKDYGKILFTTATGAKSLYCQGDSIFVSFNLAPGIPMILGNLSWTYTGASDTTIISGPPNDTLFTIKGLRSGGQIQVWGTVDMGATGTCTFIVVRDIPFSTLVADAGPDTYYIPGQGPVNFGVSTCESGGVPPYSPLLWSPTPIGPQVCETLDDNLLANTIYTLTVTDQKCAATDEVQVTLVCPPPTSIGGIGVNPGIPFQCKGSNLWGNYFSANGVFALSAPVSWTYTGTNSITWSGTDNVNFAINGLSSPGTIKAEGYVTLQGGSLVCPFYTEIDITLSDLVADAGRDTTYAYGSGAILPIGKATCQYYGSLTYTLPIWSPTTFIVSSGNTCTPSINGLTSDMVYILTVQDAYCTAKDTMKVLLTCPSPTSFGAVTKNPNQAAYCPGSSLAGSVTITAAGFSLSGAASWSYTGSGSLSGSGGNYTLSSLGASGTIFASGVVQLSSSTFTCPYLVQTQVIQSDLTADMGGIQVYVPGSGAMPLNTSCAFKGNPPYIYSWSPSTFMTTASTICQPLVNNVSATTVYTLTVTDTYCTASSQLKLVLAQEPYAVLRKIPDGGYYKINANNTLYFKYDSEYNTGAVRYRILNEQNAVVCDQASTPLSKTYGDNRYAINLPGAGITAAGYYYLELINEKNEVFKLKFKL